MKKIQILLLLLLAVSQCAFGNTRWGLTAGVNVSRFYDIYTEMEPGFHLGFIRENSLDTGAFTSYGLIFSSKRTLVTNKSVGGWANSIYLWDIDIQLLYLQVPILYNYQFSMNQHPVFVSVGPVLSLCLADFSEKTKKELLFSSAPPNYKYDYYDTYGEQLFYPQKSSSFGFELGIGAKSENLTYKLFSHIDFTNISEIKGIKINQPFISFGFLVEWFY